MTTEKQPTPRVSTRVLLRGALWIGIGTILTAVAALAWFNQRAYEIRTSGLENTAKLMADGVAIAIEEDVIAQNYAALENRLRQTLADIQVLSILVADRDGRVLSYVQRESTKHEAKPVYRLQQIPVPAHASEVSIDHDVVTQWLRLEAGVPIGWLELKISATEIDHALTELRHDVSTWLLLACLVLLAALTAVLLRTRGLVRMEEAALQARNDALTQVAYHDSLTGLPNRQLLLDRLEQAVAFSQRQHTCTAVCFMDLDGFKDVNDKYGHDVGDQVLKEVGRRLQMCVRKNDTVARLGGDEFVILLAQVKDAAACEEVLGRVLTAIRQPIQIMAHITANVSTSLGVAIYPTDDNSSPSVLLEYADQAMYVAKRSGKNRWSFYKA